LKKFSPRYKTQTILDQMKTIWTQRFLFCVFIATFSPAAPSCVGAADWLAIPSTFSHSPATGERIRQYSQVEAPPIVDQSRRVSSGYTHLRSTIQFGQSADNYHRVDEWGPPVRPYGEWRFPYRPYSAPYSEWGAPFAGLNLGFGFPGVGFPGGNQHGGNQHGGNQHGGNQHGGGHSGGGYPGTGFPGGGSQQGGYPGTGYPDGGIPGQPQEPYPANPNSPYPVPPWFDGFYPDYPVQQPLNDREFFRSPLDRR